MVRFHSPNRRRPRDYLSRREQWRLLLLVMSLGLVVIAMGVIRRPETAAWLGWLLTGGQAARQPAGGDAGHGVPPSEAAAPAVPVAAPAAPGGASRYFPGVDPGLLATIRDNTYFRSDEQAAWFNLLSIVQKTPEAELQAASIGEVSYSQLVDQPNVYRGQLVAVRGTVHQVTLQHPAENDIGLESYYRLVLRPADGGVWPIFAYVLELPAGMWPGEDPSADVAITGFYFKKLSYQWQDGLGIAPVVVAKGVTSGVALQASETRHPHSSPLPEREGTRHPHAGPLPEGEGTKELAKVLALAGWDQKRLAAFGDDTALTDDQRQSLVDLAWRLRQIGPDSLAEWARKDISAQSLVAEPDGHRGELVGVAGRLRGVTRHPLSADQAERLDMPAYFECALELDGGVRAAVLAARVPKAWLQMSELDQPASASALFVKRLPEGDREGRLLLVADGIAWHPTEPQEPLVSYGESVLGSLGMDVGLLEEVHNHQPILATEREAFYEMLAAAGRAEAGQLIRDAEANLGAVRDQWAREAKRLGGEPASAERQPGAGTPRLTLDDARRLLAEEVVRRMDGGQYSVAPLFNDPDGQIGRLVVLDGVARRAERVDVGTAPDGSPSDVLRRFGIDHYYELDLFTDDSQDYPLVFCLRELPAGFPTGGAIHAPVRVAGFFFKSWLYQTRKPEADATGVPQYAPLLVGRAPIPLPAAVAGSQWPAVAVGGLLVVALAGVWGLVWWYAQGDRRFDRTVLARRRELPEGKSLNDLEIPDNPADRADRHDQDG